MATQASQSDVIIIGGGHNGLVCAGYLAKAGRSVRVFEARDVLGGAAITEEFHPGFRNSVYSYSVSLLHPQVIADLSLERHGLEIMERAAGTLSLLDNDHLLLTRDDAQARAEIARFSARDADRIEQFESEISTVAIALRQLGDSVTSRLWRRLARFDATVISGKRCKKARCPSTEGTGNIDDQLIG
jgi:phytoene dehydrogenase-like protein